MSVKKPRYGNILKAILHGRVHGESSIRYMHAVTAVFKEYQICLSIHFL